MEIKVSPYHIISYMWRFALFFISLPVQTLVFLSFPNLTLGAFVFLGDILLITLFTITACIHYKSIKVYLSKNRIRIIQGVVFRHVLSAHKEKINSINLTQGILRKLTGVYKVTIVYTEYEAVLYLNAQNKENLSKAMAFHTCETPAYKSEFLSSIIMSAGFHNSLSGALSLIPLLKSIGTLSDGEIILNTIESTGFLTYLMPQISPVLTSLAVLIFLLWLAGGVITFIKFYPLKLFSSHNSLSLQRGYIIRRNHTVTREDIRSIVVRKSILMILLGKCYAELFFSTEKGENRLPLICADTPASTARLISQLGFNIKDYKRILKPNSKALWGYTLFPVSVLLGTSLLIIFTDIFSPYTLYPHVGVFVILWLCGWFFLRVYAFIHSGIKSENNLLRIKSFSGLSLTEAIIPCGTVRALKISQTIFQKRHDTCTLRIYIKCRKRKAFFIKHTDHKKTAELIEKFCG